MRVGLVLGAGGVLGGAWLTGGLEALARETGWDPGSADYVVGTSAGAMIGALCAAGVPPWFMVAHSAGETFTGVVDASGRPAAEADRSAGAVFRLERALPPIGPGSPALGVRSVLRPHRHTPAALVAGWLPRGIISTEPLKQTVRRVVPSGWSYHPRLWIVACDYSTGRRVPFGRAGAPEAELADAVAASCAIPGFYHPVKIGGRRYVDGGLYSNSNLDLLRDEDLDLVICLNPTSTLHPLKAWNPADRLANFVRGASGRRLGSRGEEAACARDRGGSDPADRERPRGDGREPDEHAPAPRRDQAGDRDGGGPAPRARGGREAGRPAARRSCARQASARSALELAAPLDQLSEAS